MSGATRRLSACLGLEVLLGFDRLAEELPEFLLAAEVSRHQELHQAPEFPEMIFHGSSGETETVPG